MRPAQYLKQKFSPFHRWRGVARRAARAGDWARAAAALRQANKLRPSPALTVQLGHALKESGEPHAAIDAYRRAAALMPRDLDVREHLAALLRSVNETVAAAQTYAEMLTIDPRCFPAQRALAELGQRRLLPALTVSRELMTERADRLGMAISEMRAAGEAWLVAAAFGPSHYHQFRSLYPTPPPPGAREGQKGDWAALILCEGASEADIRATLDSVAGMSHRCRSAILMQGAADLGERVAALPQAALLTVCTRWQDVADHLDPLWNVVMVMAGVSLDRQAVSWFDFAGRRNGAAVVYGDHDFRVDSVPHAGWLTAPTLFGVHDADAIAEGNARPLAAWIAASHVYPILIAQKGTATAGAAIGALLQSHRGIVHVPRILATFNGRSLPSLTTAAAPAPRPINSNWPHIDEQGVSPRAAMQQQRRMTVIIPTRDQPDMLCRCISSLRQTAAQPDALTFVVVDNRSTGEETRGTLRRLTREGVSVVVDDQPFNWSRINNAVARRSSDEILVFSNNDVESMVDGWDTIVSDTLERSDVGVVGARLLYPDRTLQHAGVTFGITPYALSAHEGVGAFGDLDGPNARWITRRAAAAVTGAFMASTRQVFEKAGGFDERLAIAYNDLDYCFRIRAMGLKVLYEPELLLLHHESKTRGRISHPDQIEWDLREQALFRSIWGEATEWDPGYNPQWALGGVPFDGYREPSIAEVTRHIDCQVDGLPWKTIPCPPGR